MKILSKLMAAVFMAAVFCFTAVTVSEAASIQNQETAITAHHGGWGHGPCGPRGGCW